MGEKAIEGKKAAWAKRHRILGWRGILAQSGLMTRVTAFVIVAVMSVWLAFVQWGFIGIGDEGAYEAYAIALLAPVAVGALLFGILRGGIIGFIAGVALYAHAQIQPLDFYEMLFIVPENSIFLFTVTGLLLGWLFAVALRKNPPPARRAIYIAIVCVFASSVFSVVFFVVATIHTLIGMAVAQGVNLTDAQVYEFGNRVGDPFLQMVVDAFIMMVLCMVVDAAVRLQRRRTGNYSLRTVFRVWLLVVVGVAFMITGAMSFATITEQEIQSARARMDGEVEYLATHVEKLRTNTIALLNMLDAKGVDIGDLNEKDIDALDSAVSMSSLLDGYTKEEDGTIIVSYDKTILQSNDPAYKPGTTLEEIYGGNVDGLLSDLANGEMIRIVYDDKHVGNQDLESYVDSAISTQIAFMRGARIENPPIEGIEIGGGDDADASASVDAASDTASDVAASAAGESEAAGDSALDSPDASESGSSAASDGASSVSSSSAASADSDGDPVDDAYYVLVIFPSSSVFSERTNVMAVTSLSVSFLLVAVFFVVSFLLNRIVVRRIDETNGVLAKITDGNLDERVDIRDSREFESLSTGVNTTVDALKGWISEAETRMDRELSTAKAIQESALPRTFPPFPDILHFDIYASMKAAKEVGGDFYDFFLVGDDAGPDAGKLGFVIADVSGKGVPAALFMMTAKTLVRNFVESGMELSEAVENANRQLCDGNDAGMFVTLFVGLMDYSTGHVDYVNAGHNPPLLWKADLPDSGAWQWVEDKSGIPLGLFDGMPYEAFRVDLNIGSQFVLYTDGVTEAMNPAGELYGEARLRDLVESNVHLHPRPMIECIRDSLSNWASGAEQSDDITMLVLEYGVPPELTATLVVSAETSQLTHVNDFVHSELDRRLCPVRAQNQLDIALEELFVNVCHYAYPDATPDKPGVARISRTYSADPPSITVEIADDGIPYNPLAKPDAVTPDDIMDVPIGGLGILMAKNSVDEMTYERIDNSNVVTIVKKW